MLRSARAVSASVSVALLLVVSVLALFDRSGSTMPEGGATLAVLLSVPVADASIVAVAMNVTLPLGARSTVVSMSPLPLGEAQLDPTDAVHVQVAPDRASGKR